jgi:hypothetical protein
MTMLEGPRSMMVYTKPYHWLSGFWAAATQQVESAGGATRQLGAYFMYYTRDRIDIGGLAANQLAVFPQGWSVQEIRPPLSTALEGKLEGGDNGPINQFVEIHDLWTTVELTRDDIFGKLFRNNYQFGPAMEGQDAAANDNRYLDFEQVIAARSRVWVDDGSLLQKGAGSWPVFNFLRKVHDCQWGSGEPIGNDILYHVRAVRFYYDTDANGDPTGNAQVFIPASIQPMLTIVDKPKDIAYLAMKQRSLDV